MSCPQSLPGPLKEIIYRDGDPLGNVYVVLNGSVVIHRALDGGLPGRGDGGPFFALEVIEVMLHLSCQWHYCIINVQYIP